MIYDITVESVTRKSYLVEADDWEKATTSALELAIKDNPGADVWVHGDRPK